MKTVALINGHAFAGGFMVAMMHDVSLDSFPLWPSLFPFCAGEQEWKKCERNQREELRIFRLIITLMLMFDYSTAS